MRCIFCSIAFTFSCFLLRLCAQSYVNRNGYHSNVQFSKCAPTIGGYCHPSSVYCALSKLAKLATIVAYALITSFLGCARWRGTVKTCMHLHRQMRVTLAIWLAIPRVSARVLSRGRRPFDCNKYNTIE